MSYRDRLKKLKDQLEQMGSLAKLDLLFAPGRPPNQAYSEFLTRKEQGDWAEQTFVENFNRTASALWAVKYGRSEDLVAGEPGFDAYYEAYQQELTEIGKRPDLLLFQRDDFLARSGTISDISTMPRDELDALVPRARAAIEVRSSSFLSRKYDAVASEVAATCEARARDCARQLLADYRAELARKPEWIPFLERLVADQGPQRMTVVPPSFNLRSTSRYREAGTLARQVREALKTLRQRDFLSITPKAEDLSLVYRWIERFDVAHHYCQVFFDRAVLISFERILEILADPTLEEDAFFVEADEKNQGKVTFKINIRRGQEIMSDIQLPTHCSAMKELPKGRLLFYVRFAPSAATIDPTVVTDA